MLKNSTTPLPLGYPSGVLRLDVLQCTAGPAGVFDRMFPGPPSGSPRVDVVPGPPTGVRETGLLAHDTRLSSTGLLACTTSCRLRACCWPFGHLRVCRWATPAGVFDRPLPGCTTSSRLRVCRWATPAGVFDRPLPGCTTSSHLRVCRWATPAGVFDRPLPGCTTSSRLRMCCWRAAQNRRLQSRDQSPRPPIESAQLPLGVLKFFMDL